MALKAEIGPLIDSLATNKRFAKHIEERIDEKEAEIKTVENEMTKLQENARADQLEFMRFAVNYINELKTKWWESSPENQKLCLELLFPCGIYIKKGVKVYIPEISPIYRLVMNKNEPNNTQKSQMVRVRRIELLSPVWKTGIIAAIRHPRSRDYNK